MKCFSSTPFQLSPFDIDVEEFQTPSWQTCTIDDLLSIHKKFEQCLLEKWEARTRNWTTKMKQYYIYMLDNQDETIYLKLKATLLSWV